MYFRAKSCVILFLGGLSCMGGGGVRWVAVYCVVRGWGREVGGWAIHGYLCRQTGVQGSASLFVVYRDGS